MASLLLASLLEDIKTAMKAGEKERLLTLRTLHSEIKNAVLQSNGEITDEIVTVVAAKGIKQRLDAIDQFEKAGRADLVEREKAQAVLYGKYQLQQLSPAELTAIVRAAIAESGAASRKDAGKVMKLVMAQTRGRADGKSVNQMVMDNLPA